MVKVKQFHSSKIILRLTTRKCQLSNAIHKGRWTQLVLWMCTSRMISNWSNENLCKRRGAIEYSETWKKIKPVGFISSAALCSRFSNGRHPVSFCEIADWINLKLIWFQIFSSSNLSQTPRFRRISYCSGSFFSDCWPIAAHTSPSSPLVG